MFQRSKDDTPREIAALAKLKQNLQEAYAAKRWDKSDEAAGKLIAYLRAQNETIGASQSELAEWHAQRGIALHHQRRYEPAYEQLQLAGRWLDMSLDDAADFGRSQGLTVAGEGQTLDTGLVLMALELLGDGMVQRGAPGAGDVLQQVVAVADIVGEPERMWNARQRLATYTAGLADWDGLLRIAQELGQFAHRSKSLSALMAAMRLIVEAFVSLRRLDEARAAQQLVVDIARFIKDASLPAEEAEMARLVTIPR